MIESRRTPTQESVVSENSRAEVKTSRHAKWSVQLGAAFILIGAVALITAGVSRPASVVPYAWLLVTAGVVASVHAFHLRRSDRFFLEIVPAIASIPVALLMVTHPFAGALPWMWQFASFFTVVGLFRIDCCNSNPSSEPKLGHRGFHSGLVVCSRAVVRMVLAAPLVHRHCCRSMARPAGLVGNHDCVFSAEKRHARSARLCALKSSNVEALHVSWEWHSRISQQTHGR